MAKTQPAPSARPQSVIKTVAYVSRSRRRRGCRSAAGQTLGAVIPKRLPTEDGEHPREVVAQDHQGHLAADLLEAAHQEVIPAEPAFEGAEGVLDQAGALAHPLGSLRGHALAVDLEHRGMLAAIKLPPRGLRGQADALERAAMASVGRTGVALAQDAVDGRRFALRAQDLPTGTDVGVSPWDILELRPAEAPCSENWLVLVGNRDVDGDVGLGTGGQFLLTIVASIGHNGERRDPQHLLGGDGLRGQLPAVVAGVGYLVVGDEAVLVVHHALDVVAHRLLAALVQDPRVGISTRALGLAALLQILDLRAPGAL